MKLNKGIFKSTVSFILAFSLGIGMGGSKGFAISDEEKADAIRQTEQYLKDNGVRFSKESTEKDANEPSNQLDCNTAKGKEVKLVDPDEVDKFLEENKNYFPDKEIFKLRKELSKLTRKEFLRVKTLNFKSPLGMFFVSFFLGYLGVDRLLLDDVVLGLVKFLTVGGFGIWTIIDWFLIKGKTREYNLKMALRDIGEF